MTKPVDRALPVELAGGTGHRLCFLVCPVGCFAFNTESL